MRTRKADQPSATPSILARRLQTYQCFVWFCTDGQETWSAAKLVLVAQVSQLFQWHSPGSGTEHQTMRLKDERGGEVGCCVSRRCAEALRGYRVSTRHALSFFAAWRTTTCLPALQAHRLPHLAHLPFQPRLAHSLCSVKDFSESESDMVCRTLVGRVRRWTSAE